MDLIDKLSKTVSQGIDRARFEAEKFQRVSRVQGELNDIKRMLDSKMIELGYRAYDLFRAGQIRSPSISELAQAIDELRKQLVVKEDELKEAQAMTYREPEKNERSPASPPSIQNVPIEHGPTGSAAPYGSGHGGANPSSFGSAPPTKPCPLCGFLMPQRAKYCPRCGCHVGSSL